LDNSDMDTKSTHIMDLRQYIAGKDMFQMYSLRRYIY